MVKLLKRLAFHAAVVLSGTCITILLFLHGLVTDRQALGLTLVVGLLLAVLSSFLERKGII